MIGLRYRYRSCINLAKARVGRNQPSFILLKGLEVVHKLESKYLTPQTWLGNKLELRNHIQSL
jgi:hypothetical protein